MRPTEYDSGVPCREEIDIGRSKLSPKRFLVQDLKYTYHSTAQGTCCRVSLDSTMVEWWNGAILRLQGSGQRRFCRQMRAVHTSSPHLRGMQLGQ